MIDRKLNEYGLLVVRQGVNVQPGEEVVIASPITCSDFVHAIAEQAYKAGAKKVTMFYRDDELSKLSYKYQDLETLNEIPDWVIASRDYIVDSKACYINIISENPEMFGDIEPIKLITASRASRKAFKKFSTSTTNNVTRWCIVAVPNPIWAKKMFPKLSEDEAMDRQWQYIHKAMRLDEDDSLKAWNEHQMALAERSKFLTDAGIVSLTYKNSLGTDFTVGMPKNYKFIGGAEKSAGGVYFTANMPTEEIFSSPDRLTANGTLVASMPLIHNGKIIDKFSLTFKDGKVIDFSAETGYEILKGIIETDEGSSYLGEIALVGYNSPIQNLKTLFYNTLFDENASCHFALGRAYSSCIEGGENMTEEELKSKGLNQSLEHTDFMVGTKDLTITAETENGHALSIFKNGDWDLKTIK